MIVAKKNNAKKKKACPFVFFWFGKIIYYL